jgi:hypothetical protein
VYEAHGKTEITRFFPVQERHWFWIVDASNQALAGGKRPSD